ncbi:hypothetical protein H5T51_04295, partial [Candidatus Bathyarchaeota archaeon]|nr:hypothetical protein [Candidatus Bathyarchaeota archaeon]
MKPANPSKAHKGISPILATLLLVVIAVAAALISYAWIMSYLTATGEQAGVTLSKDAVSWLNSTDYKIVVYVRNTCTSQAKISAIY